MLGLLEIDDAAAAAADAVGHEAHLRQQGRHLTAGLHVGGGQLQVISLLRVRDAAPGQKGPPHKGGAAALILQQAEVHMQHQTGVIAQQINDAAELLLPGNAEDELVPGAIGQAVEFQGKCPLEQPGQPAGKLRVLRNNAHLRRGEGVAEQQHPIGLRPGAALPRHRLAAQFAFDFIGKGLHG